MDRDGLAGLDRYMTVDESMISGNIGFTKSGSENGSKIGP
jgi:hypothetical protein